MPIPTGPTRQTTYLAEMMQRLGIEPGEGAIPRLSMAHMTAFHRCQGCAAKDACRAWLDSMPPAVTAPPDFCPNRDILFELRIDRPGRDSAVVGRYAHAADLERYVADLNDLILSKADGDPQVGGLKAHRAHLCSVIEWLRRRPEAEACRR